MKQRLILLYTVKSILRFIICFCTLFLLVFICKFLNPSMVFAADAAGKLITAKGEVLLLSPSSKAWVPVRAGMPLHKGDQIRTGRQSRAYLLLSDESLIQLGSETVFRVQEVSQTAGWFGAAKVIQAAYKEAESFYEVVSGRVWLKNKNPNRNISIKTPTVLTGLRGTEIDLLVYGEESTVLSVVAGQAKMENTFGSVVVYPGEQASAPLGEPIRKTLMVSPREAVQWTIVVPDFASQIDFESRVGISSVDAEKGAKKAALLVQSGQISKAHTILLKLVEMQPEYGPAWVLLAVTSVMKNEIELAQKAAENATTLIPDLALVHIVSSYVKQSVYDLGGAAEELQAALTVEPENTLAMVNLAKIRFGQGFIDEAWTLNQKVEAIDPQDCDMLNLKGFLLLAKSRTNESLEAFQKAVSCRSDRGEPYMGIALCRFRQGKIDSAMEAITTAVLMEPQRSMFLSYWAKMLYQLRRFDAALDLLAQATELDPRDPTPDLYKGLILRDLYRPTEAIKSFNSAVEKNDNRAVYRSRFLLDQDLAVKNIDLSILYDQLGLTAWAIKKAVDALKTDYTNSSAHLLFAGALSLGGETDIAAASEIWLARILQPANQNSFNQFNQYTTFFDQPSISGSLTGSYGSNKTVGGSIYGSGGFPSLDLAANVEAAASETDGWREDQKQDSKDFTVAFKHQITPRDGLYFELAYLDSAADGYNYLLTEYDAPKKPLDRYDDDSSNVLIGYHHHFAPRKDFILAFNYYDYESKSSESFLTDNILGIQGLLRNRLIESNSGFPSWKLQGQQFYGIGDHQLIIGASAMWGDKDIQQSITDSYFYQGETSPSQQESQQNTFSINHNSIYIQDIWKINSLITLEGGLYYDQMDNPNAYAFLNQFYGEDVEKFSPRLGLIFSPTKSDTIRVAGFRHVAPVVSFGIEPHEIAGIPVGRNELEGTVSEEIGFVWEHEWSTGLFEIEAYYNEYEIDFDFKKENGFGTDFREENGFDTVLTSGLRKGLGGGINQLLGEGFGLQLIYFLEDIEDDKLNEYDRIDNYAVASLAFVHHTGLSAAIRQGFRYTSFKDDTRADEDIWLTDLELGYAFPNKLGEVSFVVNNLFDSHFNWISNTATQGRIPERTIFATISLNF